MLATLWKWLITRNDYCLSWKRYISRNSIPANLRIKGGKPCNYMYHCSSLWYYPIRYRTQISRYWSLCSSQYKHHEDNNILQQFKNILVRMENQSKWKYNYMYRIELITLWQKRKLLIMKGISFMSKMLQNSSSADASKCVCMWERVKNLPHSI